jgi:hypothetical protein
MERRKQLDEIFKNVEPEQKQLVNRLLDEVVFLEDKMTELKALPFVSVNPKNPARQRSTPAAKLYKECTQSYMNAIRILAGILHKVESSAQDELLKMLEDFE